ncbi:MAG: hypothetical protein ACERKT_09125 [Acidobacteriota bacterium]
MLDVILGILHAAEVFILLILINAIWVIFQLWEDRKRVRLLAEDRRRRGGVW